MMMPTIAYIANEFPSPVEPYVGEEILELRRRGMPVVPCGVRRPRATLDAGLRSFEGEAIYLRPLRTVNFLRGAWLCVLKFGCLSDLVGRVLLRGSEGVRRRVAALAHTWMGACLAVSLAKQGVTHVHAHHGYSASWIAMVAARLLDVDFSMTLHGSDLLLHRAYLDTKLENCKFCVTVSQFNREHILKGFPAIDRGKVILQRLGVDAPKRRAPDRACLLILAVGRLHPVKDHDFLVRGCRALKDHGIAFMCLIAGDGPERAPLEKLIARLGLQQEVRLLGHLSRQALDAYYRMCDLVVLTSRSEGLPLVLMEAMAHGKTVLAPAITGIPELVMDGKTGFLYRPGSLEEFVARIETISHLRAALAPIKRAARRHVFENFDRRKNLAAFGDLFLRNLNYSPEAGRDEDLVLQQV